MEKEDDTINKYKKRITNEISYLILINAIELDLGQRYFNDLNKCKPIEDYQKLHVQVFSHESINT